MSKSTAFERRSLKSELTSAPRHAALSKGSGAVAATQRATVAYRLGDVPARRAAPSGAPAQLVKKQEDGKGKAKPMDGLSRIRRANARAEKRAQKAPRPPLGKRRESDTLFGPVGVSKGRGNQPYVTTRQEDFPGEKSIRGTYDSLQTMLGTPGLLEKVVAATKRGAKPKGGKKSRPAATLLGIVGEAESMRFPGADKVFRSVARRVKDAKSWKRAFSGNDPIFAMAAKGGAQAYNEALSGKRSLTQEQLDAAANMSDSSDDEDDGRGRLVGRKRLTRRRRA